MWINYQFMAVCPLILNILHISSQKWLVFGNYFGLPNILPQLANFFTRIYPSYPWHFPTLNITHQQEVLEQLTQLQLLLSCRLYLQTVLTSCDNQHWSVSDHFAANILLWVVVRIHQGLWSQPIQCCCQNILIWSNFYWSEINTPLLVVNMLWFQYPVPNWMMKGVSWGQGMYGSEMGGSTLLFYFSLISGL